jgi:hypothetical protein
MHHSRKSIQLALFAVLAAFGCGGTPDQGYAWLDRGATSEDPGPETAPAGELTTLGTPFVIHATTLSAQGTVQPLWIDGAAPFGLAPGSVQVRGVSLVLRSNGFALGLEPVSFLVLESGDTHRQFKLTSPELVSGAVIASSPDFVHALFSVRFSIADPIDQDQGEAPATASEAPVVLSLKIHRKQEAIVIDLGIEGQVAVWTQGACRINGGPLTLELTGVIGADR